MIRRIAALAAAAIALSVPAIATSPTATAAPTVSAATSVSSAASAKPPRGSTSVRIVKVTDGDTIRVRIKGKSTPVRLIGLNAPEVNPRQCYGSQATSRMKQLTTGGTVYIKADSTQGNKDKYGRLLRHVYSPKGTSLALRMIDGGYAREYTYNRAYAGRSTHLSAQSRARSAKRGLWRSCVATPKPTPKPQPVTSCKIKGNISSSGERIYHVPGGRSYSVTVITPSKGERWFCSESQAVNAGWRKAKN